MIESDSNGLGSNSNSHDEDQLFERMPDPDAIKMFVGQIPKVWNENDVKRFFEDFGSIYMVNVLRDKVTKQSRGCCFITFFTRKSALDAQNATHNLKILPGMNHPMQMKPADNENRTERKIFVGMISKKMSENDLRNMFTRFGLIEECNILRDSGGQSRGCGFITFSSKSSALTAIKIMHQSTILEGCSSPVVVKIADTRRQEKEPSSPPSVAQTPLPDLTLAQKANYISMFQLLQQQQNSSSSLAAPAYGGYTLSTGNPINSNLPNTLGIATPTGIQQNATDLSTLTLLASLSPVVQPPTPQITALPNINPPSTLQVNGTPNNFTISNFSSPPTVMSTTCQNSASSPGSLQVEGPDGSNLFIYHLPQDFTDSDLFQAFLPFGTILSARVFIDRITNLSKCFGFVSYDNAYSAQSAIQSMNGFQIGHKRLKVQLKRSKDKPY